MSGVAIEQRLLEVEGGLGLASFVFHGNQTCASVNGTPISCEPTWKNQFSPVPLKIAL